MSHYSYLVRTFAIERPLNEVFRELKFPAAMSSMYILSMRIALLVLLLFKIARGTLFPRNVSRRCVLSRMLDAINERHTCALVIWSSSRGGQNYIDLDSANHTCGRSGFPRSLKGRSSPNRHKSDLENPRACRLTSFMSLSSVQQLANLFAERQTSSHNLTVDLIEVSTARVENASQKRNPLRQN